MAAEDDGIRYSAEDGLLKYRQEPVAACFFWHSGL